MASSNGLAPHFLGANSLETAPNGAVKDFVAKHEGHTVITSVLIANNGIAAVKEIRSVRKWAYETFGDERAVQFTVMATPEDLKANADYIRMADQYVEVPGGSNNNNYANVDLIVDIAERMGVHAVWAGWGHASENPKLPETLAKSHIVFIGPPGSAMRSLGDKISSTIVAQHAKVPCIPWSGTGVETVVVDNNGIVTVADEVYTRGCTRSPAEGLEKAKVIGFPVMIKASEGGGGKGIRKVESEENFQSLYSQVISEVPGSPVFIMKLASNARHLEVQLLADQYGNNISLFGRDCSVQRRHQKIIEEAPVTVARPETFTEMEKAAVRLGRLVGYVSAGTVEYLYSHSDDKFYFLELNPRLQVEHPTTEMVTGVNLPAAQLQIAMGISLHRIRDIRLLYGVDPATTTPIDFDFSSANSNTSQRRPKPKGHTTACRITSEDPGEGFKPSSGTVHELNFRSSSNVWGYFSVSSSGGIHSFSDSQFGHIFAYGENRTESRKHMVVALKELSIRGDFRTTIEYLIKLLETPAFEDNVFTTGWLDELISKKLTAERPDAILAVICGAVCKAHVAGEACLTAFRQSLEKGQPPPKDILKTIFNIDFIYEGQRYKFTSTRSSSDSYHLFINGSKCAVGVRDLADGGLLILLNGKSHTCYFREEVGATRLSVDSKTCLLEQENDPTQLRTPSPGKLVRFIVENGEHVKAGQPYAEVEVMKMYMPLVTAEDGVVQLIKQPGATLEAGDILGILALDDPSRVKHAKPFEGQLPDLGPPQRVGSKPPQRFNLLVGILKNILDGYDNQVIMSSTLKELIEVLRIPELPYGEWNNQISALHSRMPQKLDSLLEHAIEKAEMRGAEFPAKNILKVFERFFEDLSAGEAEVLRSQMQPLLEIAHRYEDGLKAHEYYTFVRLLEQYWNVEQLFSGPNAREEDVVLRLRDEHKDSITDVVGIMLSHSRIGSKNNLVLAMLEEYKPRDPETHAVGKYLKPILRKLAELDQRGTAKVAIKAREVLIQCALPSLEERTIQLQHILRASVVETKYGESGFDHRLPSINVLKDVIDSKYTVFDVLPFFFAHQDPWLGLAAMELYVRRANRAYSLLAVDYHVDAEPFIITWQFKLRRAIGGEDVEVGQGSLHPSQPPTPSQEEADRGFRRVASVSDMSYFSTNTVEDTRLGVVAPVAVLDDVDDVILRALDCIPKQSSTSPGLMPDMSKHKRISSDSPGQELANVCNILVADGQTKDDKELFERIRVIVDEYKEEFRLRRIRRVTFVLGHKDGLYPKYFTFRGPAYEEDQSIRHIEPALAFQLELSRLSNFNIKPIFLDNRNIHVYEAIGKEVPSDKRYFTRAIVRPGRLRDDIPTAEHLISETHSLVNDILDGLEIIGNNNSDLNHIFINFSPVFKLSPSEIEAALGGFLERFGRRLWRLRVTNAEIRIVCSDDNGNVTPIRVLINNVSGFVVRVELYMETKSDKGDWIFKSIGPAGGMHLRSVNSPYPTKEWLQPKRYKAHLMGTTYVYDFPDLFRQAVRASWQEAIKNKPSLKEPEDVLETKELIIDENADLVEVTRDPGTNVCGMVAWLLVAKTPEYPRGRRFVVIANDITFKIGSFGPTEDLFFFKATELARKLGIPRIYLSANSGARIGVAEELIPHFSVAWNDPSKPDKGFKYLYLTPEAKERFHEFKEVITERVVEDGEERFKITTIIGAEDGIGVECLRGSGMIAGATARAYEDIFTATLVTCRSVGIGAYLVRLGQRAVQVEGQPIILTGAGALNKVLGREVYSSNLQIGGTQIMYKNGVSHLTANDDLDGINKIVKWMSFVPDRRGAPVPVSPASDPWNRDIEFMPSPKEPYDVRWLLGGKEDDDGFQSGFFDRNSFQETLSGWARTVVVGRARLAGIPMGVIAVETRMIENVVQADPANLDSTEQVNLEAAQVWYPNSAFKTAQAINDFNHGEQLPLIIFANWRGFSGGQRDMYNEVLKYGSYIVDALVKYQQPIFIYIPPFGELRGGSWVVLDPTINPDMMEMYADEESRAGVLEPEGMVGIKFRREKLLDTMARLDPEYSALSQQLKRPGISSDEQSDIKVKLVDREKLLMPMYTQVSIQFADLHDRAGRMQAKGAIRQSLQWKDARRIFYWRVRRRINEEQMLKRIAAACPRLPRDARLAHLRSWYRQEQNYETDDRAVASWLESNSKMLLAEIEQLKQDATAAEVVQMARNSKEGMLKGLAQLLQAMTLEERTEYLQSLS